MPLDYRFWEDSAHFLQNQHLQWQLVHFSQTVMTSLEQRDKQILHQDSSVCRRKFPGNITDKHEPVAGGWSWAYPASGAFCYIHSVMSEIKIDRLIPVLSPEIQLHGRSSHLWGRSGPSSVLVASSAHGFRSLFLKTHLIKRSRLASVLGTSRLLSSVKCASMRVRPRTRKCFFAEKHPVDSIYVVFLKVKMS